MKIVNPTHRIMIDSNPYRHIEKIGRICYKSENHITNKSAESFVGRLFNNGHHAMLEHFRFIIEISKFDYEYLTKNPYHKYLTFTNDGRYVVSASARGFNDMYNNICNYLDNSTQGDDTTDAELTKTIIEAIVHKIIHAYDCPMIFLEAFRGYFGVGTSWMQVIKDFDELSNIEYNMHAWYSVKLVCDRGVSHEIVRHRDASFAQESTRYCNYRMGKFGTAIAVINPFFFDKNEERKITDSYDWTVNKYDIWETCMKNLEKAYMGLIELGATPQEARTILPNSLKTEIVVTAQVYEWHHIFDLRVHGVTGTPHPQMEEVMRPVYNDMVSKGYI